MNENYTDFEFTPEMRWDYHELVIPLDASDLPLTGESVRVLVLRNFFGMEIEDLGTAMMGAKHLLGALWSVCYTDSGGNQFGTAHLERGASGEPQLVIRIEDLG